MILFTGGIACSGGVPAPGVEYLEGACSGGSGPGGA